MHGLKQSHEPGPSTSATLDVLHHHHMEGRVWRLAWFLCSLEEFVKVQWAERCHILQSSYQLQVHYVSNHSLHLWRWTMWRTVSTKLSEMGYSLIHDKQKEVILGFLRGRDVFVSFPVESGKVGATPFCLKYSIV